MSEFSLDNVNSMYMDVLKEIGNIGAGNATTAIAGMLVTTMKMEVPRVLLMDATKLGDAICPEEETIVGIFLEVTNDISGMIASIVISLIAVVLGSPSSADRFHSATTLLDYGFANYAAAPLPTLPERPLALAVKGSVEDSVPLDYAALPETILIEKGTASALRAELTLPEALEAPIEKGRTVGKVSVFQDDTLLNEYEVKAAADAPLLTFGGALELLWQCLLGA